MRFIIVKHEVSERLSDYKEKIDMEIVALENKGYEVVDIEFGNPYSIIKYKNKNIVININGDELKNAGITTINKDKIDFVGGNIGMSEQNIKKMQQEYDEMQRELRDEKAKNKRLEKIYTRYYDKIQVLEKENKLLKQQNELLKFHQKTQDQSYITMKSLLEEQVNNLKKQLEHKNKNKREWRFL